MRIARTFAATLAFAISLGAAQAEKLSLSSLSAYLNELETARSEFTQINDDGSITTGRIFIRRPGRIRFEYNPPDESLVVAGEGQVAIFDAKSNQPPEKFQLASTPLYLILEKTVDLGRARMVVGHLSDDLTTTVVAQDPNHPEYGSISLVFTADPIELRQWIVTDGTGAKTTVILGELEKGVSLRRTLFDIDAESEARGF